MKVLVLSLASVQRVVHSVQRLLARERQLEVVVAVPEVEQWKYRDTGLETLTLGEGWLPFASAWMLETIAAYDLVLIPLDVPRQSYIPLARLVRAPGSPRFCLDAGPLRHIRHPQLISLLLIGLSLLCWGPISLALHLGRFLDALALLGCQLVARVLRRRRPTTGSTGPICHIIEHVATGGAQRQLVEYLRESRIARAELRLLVLRDYNEFFLEEIRGLGLQVEILSRQYRSSAVGLLCDRLFPLCSALWALQRRLVRMRPACTYSWLFMTNVLAAPAARLARVPMIISSIRNMSEWKAWPGYRRWWFRPADRLSAPLNDLLVANASAVADDYAAWAGVQPDRLRVIRNGIDVAALLRRPCSDVRARLGIPPEVPMVLSVGRLADEKHHELLLRACALVHDRGRQLRLVLVGHGSCEPRLRELCASLGLAASTIFAGKSGETQSYYRSADLFVLSSRIEGMPNAVMEAQAFGLPVVTTDSGGSAEVVEHGRTGLVVGRDDVQGMADAIARLLASPELRHEMGRRGAERVQSELGLQRMVAAIDELCGGIKPPASGDGDNAAQH